MVPTTQVSLSYVSGLCGALQIENSHYQNPVEYIRGDETSRDMSEPVSEWLCSFARPGHSSKRSREPQ